jgi:outer membrane beta-barrel protein
MNRLLSPWLFAALCLSLSLPAFAASEDEAGDVSEVDKDSSGPLRDRIRPVSGHLFLMKGRFELSPSLGISFRDAFFSKYIPGASLTYHFNDDWAISARAGYGIDVVSGAAQICTPTGGCRPPTWEELTLANGTPSNKAYGLITLLSTLDLQWSPLYGKLSLSAEKFLYFNMYAIAGGGILSYGPNAQMAPCGNLGVGFRFFVNRFLTLRLEMRDTIYVETGLYQINNSNDSLRNQLMGEVGFSIFFPMQFEEGH